MELNGQILLADDEEPFARNTVKLFEKHGYACDWAPDAATAMGRLKEQPYDVVVADIRMPGNPQLEFIHEISSWDERPPVILITGYPSMESAVDAVGLPVVAYLIKPFEFDELLSRVQDAQKFKWARNAVATAREADTRWREELDKVEAGLPDGREAGAPVPVEALVELTMRRAYDSLKSLHELNRMMASPGSAADMCEMVGCPRLGELKAVIEETVDTLEETKSSFKSRRLKELREKLETVLKNMQQ
jgi:CheY-like chemotaxis protein